MLTPKWLTRQQAAEYLGLSPKTLANWAYQRRGPKFSNRTGGHPLYRSEDLDAWVTGVDSAVKPNRRGRPVAGGCHVA